MEEKTQNQALGIIADVITYYNRYGMDFFEWDWRETIKKDFATALQEAEQKPVNNIANFLKDQIEHETHISPEKVLAFLKHEYNINA